jgi:hypothetical protein
MLAMKRIAPLHGTTVIYCHSPDSKVLIQKDDYKYRTIPLDLFNRLYIELDGSRAALKEDCIEYTIHRTYKPLDHYPDWYVDAVYSEAIYSTVDGQWLFYEDDGEKLMSPGSVVLRNFMEDLRYMEREDFDKYYELIGG